MAPLTGSEVVADIVAGESQPVLPGVVLSRHGKGRVAYMATAMESLFLQTNLRRLSEFIATLVAWATPVPPPYSVSAPDGLIVNMTVRPDMQVLHLANGTGNKLDQPGTSEAYIAPVENVRVQLRKPQGRQFGKLALLVKAASTEKEIGTGLEISLSQVEAYQAIVIPLV